MRCRHQGVWPLRIELLEKLSWWRKGSEWYEGGGGEVYANEHHLYMLKKGKKMELKIIVCPQPAV